MKYLCVILAYACLSCTALTNTLSPSGDTAEIITVTETKLTGELLAVSDSSFFVNMKPLNIPSAAGMELYEIPFGQMKKLTIHNYANTQWKGAIIAFEVVPAIILGLTAASGGGDAGALLLLMAIPPVINYAILSSSTPPAPGITEPATMNQIEGLKKYARFPQGLTAPQLQQILTANHQDYVKHLK
jgi:hypothetical protein